MNIIYHYYETLKQQVRTFMNFLTHQVFPNSHYMPGTVLGVMKVAGMIRHSWVFQNLQSMEIQITIKKVNNGQEIIKKKRGSFCESRT